LEFQFADSGTIFIDTEYAIMRIICHRKKNQALLANIEKENGLPDKRGDTLAKQV
jgi:hypothetical protein